MKMQGVREVARSLGVPLTFGGTKQNLVKSIQRAEGNFPCFGSAHDGDCDQVGCLWRDDCFRTGKRA